jgi:uncharacterized protein (DUF2336 family)
MNIAQQFLLYANKIDSQKRAEMTSVLAKAYASQTEPHPDEDSVLLALMAMAADPDVEVRQALAEIVAVSDRFPRSLYVAFANDVPSVAEPIFASATMLSDAELLTGLANNNEWLQCAIAARPDLSTVVVEALARTASSVAVLTLLRNENCRLTLDASEWIWQRFEDKDDSDHKHVMECLLARPDVSELVKLKIDFLDEDPEQSPQPDMKLLERKLDGILARSSKAEALELPFMARFLHERNWLNTVLIIRAGLAGQLSFTASLLAQAASINHNHALRLCRMGGFGLRALCGYAGLSKSSAHLLAVIVHELKGQQEGQPIDSEGLKRLIMFMETQGTSAEDVIYCIILQIEAKQAIGGAHRLWTDLARQEINDPDMPEPTEMQDMVEDQAPSDLRNLNPVKTNKGLKRPEMQDDWLQQASRVFNLPQRQAISAQYATVPYSNLAYKTVSA